MYNFDFYNPVRLVFGQNRLEELATMELPGKKALIVCTPERFYVDRTKSLLKKNDVESVVFDEVRPNPSSAGIDKAADLGRKEGCDFVIGLGGGSSIDSAKGVAIALKNEGPIWDYVSFFEDAKGYSEAAPIVAISTTSGTGTEADPYAVLTNDDLNMKLDLWNDVLYPKISIVDPCLQVSIPKLLTAAQGLDVILHASEVFLNKNRTPYSDMFATQSLIYAKDNIVEAYNNGANVEAREGMALASNLAGMAMSIIDTISLHAMSHVIGALHNKTPHGVALALFAVEAFKHYAKHTPERMSELSDAIGFGFRPEGFVEFIEELLKALDLYDIDFTEYGIDPARSQEYGEHCLTVLKDYCASDEYPMTMDDCTEIFRKSLIRAS